MKRSKKIYWKNLQNKKRSSYEENELEQLEVVLNDYWDKSRALVSETIVDLEKHLWLANAAAATISIGYIQANDDVPQLQLCGAWSFIIGIILLVIMKFVSAYLC